MDIVARNEFLHEFDLFDVHLSEPQLDERYIKFRDVEFGVIPRSQWTRFLHDLLPFEHMIAGSQSAIGRSKQFVFDLELEDTTPFFHRAIPYKLDQRKFIQQEMKSWEEKGIVERISGCSVASSVVLVQ